MEEFENSREVNMQYEFDKLLIKALADWPAEIDLHDIQRLGDMSRHSVKGLGVMADLISERYIGKADEVIFRNIHQSIHAILHRIAPSVTRVKTATLRSEAIQIHFEICIKDGMSIADIGYSQVDIAVCNAYFDANKKIKK
jgi:hypothetical protein